MQARVPRVAGASSLNSKIPGLSFEETKENARGQKRKLPAAQRLQLMDKILIEHIRKRMRAVGNAVRAGSSTDL